MTEEYIDELILNVKRQKRNDELKQYISQQDELLEGLVQTVCVGDEMAYVKLPIGLKPLPQKLIDRKFQFDPQPQIVMANLAGDVNFTVSMLDIAIQGSELLSCVEGSMEGVRRYLASTVFYEKGQEKINGIEVCWFSYTSNSQDGCKVYTMVFYAATEKTVVITMNCRYEQMEKWDAVAKICIKSLTGKVYHG